MNDEGVPEDPDDRMAKGYQPDWDRDSKIGRQGELYVFDAIDGIQSGRTEVKTDEMACRTGHIFLEAECLKRWGWETSGLAKTKAEIWAQNMSGVIVAAPVWQFRHAYDWASRMPGFQVECARGSHPTRGVRVPLPRLLTLLLEAKP